LSDPGRHLITSLLACGLFGYAAVSCLVFYRRMRRQIAEYKERRRDSMRIWERLVDSPQYGLTMWLTGALGVIGFTFASWQLVLSLLEIMQGK
jgi:hypothetical protein